MGVIEIEKQEKLRQFVSREVYCCQSSLVDYLLQQGIFNYEDIENLMKSEEELLDEGYTKQQIEDGDTDNIKEIFEWWIVSSFLEKDLREQGEPLLVTDYGTWWGRTCTGQAILLDGVIERIYYNLGKYNLRKEGE